MTKDNLSGPEWGVDEWETAWTIHVGMAYACDKCGTMVMVTKGGVGALEPICCREHMKAVEKPDNIR